MGLGLVFGFPCEIKQNEIKFNLRDFYSEEEKSILIKFQVFENQKEIELTTKLNFTDSETLEQENIEEKANICLTNSSEEFEKNKSKEIEQTIEYYESNKAVDLIAEDVVKRDFKSAREKLSKTKSKLSKIKRNNTPQF